MSEEDVDSWGAANNISSDPPLYLRMQYARREINRRLPPYARMGNLNPSPSQP
ncbi:hypothetical protein BYT27DRAFT_7193222 [Phlegmacium glaucopus]|nr:hypothetical protein BYT27DRAFT_7193222 [Phlegmacium glaucopus]